jgi:hypothetical protein
MGQDESGAPDRAPRNRLAPTHTLPKRDGQGWRNVADATGEWAIRRRSSSRSALIVVQQIVADLDEVLERAVHSVPAPDDGGISCASAGQRFQKRLAFDRRPAGGLGEDLTALGLGARPSARRGSAPPSTPRVSDGHTNIVSKLVSERPDRSCDSI